MGQIARRPGEEDDDGQGDLDPAGQPVDPHELVIEGPDGRRLVVRLPDVGPVREQP
ncbi:MAG: hypothetical protein AB7H43_04355 [Acidimicrobiia bacterium]